MHEKSDHQSIACGRSLLLNIFEIKVLYFQLVIIIKGKRVSKAFVCDILTNMSVGEMGLDDFGSGVGGHSAPKVRRRRGQLRNHFRNPGWIHHPVSSNQFPHCNQINARALQF